MNPDLLSLSIIANLKPEDDSRLAKKIFREYTLGMTQAATQLYWCTSRMLRLGRSSWAVRCSSLLSTHLGWQGPGIMMYGDCSRADL